MKVKGFLLILIGITLSAVTSYVVAESTINSKDVYYEDNSGLGFNNVQDAIDSTCTNFSDKLDNFQKQFKVDILNEMYPVGSIYFSTTLSTVVQVKEALGGEWEVYAKGQTLVGIDTSQTEFSSIGKTGGEKSHTLTIDEMPSHTHIQDAHTHILPYTSNVGKGFTGFGFESGGSNITNGNGIALSSTTATNQNTGGSKEHNNLQPYITVYIYRRIK